MGVNFSRRTLVVGGAAALSMIAVGGVGAAFAGERELFRPPGGQDESLLLGACIKCDRCRSACPQNVVDIAHLEDGFINARTPKLDFRKGWCDFCEEENTYRCVDSCPTGALSFGFDPAIDKIGLAAIETKECLLYRSSYCWKPCIEACVFDAIHLDDSGRLVIDENLCNGCGACEYVCPSTSYGSYTGSGLRGINIVITGRE